MVGFRNVIDLLAEPSTRKDQLHSLYKARKLPSLSWFSTMQALYRLSFSWRSSTALLLSPILCFHRPSLLVV